MERIKSIATLPELAEDDVHIWGVHVPGLLDDLNRLAQVLDDAERRRADRFRRPADRASSICARAALRILLGGYSGSRPETLTFSYSENGKPHGPDPDWAFNVSHSGDWAVLAFGRRRQIGVDIEQIRRDSGILRVMDRCFSEAEQKLVREAADPHAVFFQIWARKEAYVKACGSTLFQELSSCSVLLEEAGEDNKWFFHDLEAGSDYAAAVVSDRRIETVPCYDFNGLDWS